jgi:hypothetical protein
MEEGLDVTGYFYNPNIHPNDELIRRVDALKEYSNIKGLSTVIIDDYDMELFEKEVVNIPGDRCVNCYKLRLGSTAKYAAVNGFDCFSTTLLLSPYQKQDMIKAVGENVSRKYGIEFYYRDMRSFYNGSVRISKEMGLYRQRYCGCYISKETANEQVGFASK